MARKIELARQIEEMKVLVAENLTTLPARARRQEIGQGIAEERLERQAAILKTLVFNQAHESEFREFIAAKKGDVK